MTRDEDAGLGRAFALALIEQAVRDGALDLTGLSAKEAIAAARSYAWRSQPEGT